MPCLAVMNSEVMRQSQETQKDVDDDDVDKKMLTNMTPSLNATSFVNKKAVLIEAGSPTNHPRCTIDLVSLQRTEWLSDQTMKACKWQGYPRHGVESLALTWMVIPVPSG